MDDKFTVADVANASSLSDGREAAASDNLSALASRPVSRVRLGFSFAQAADVSGFTAGTSFDEVASESKVSSGKAYATGPTKLATPCWEWEGLKDKAGYGHSILNKENRPAHRVAWVAFCGPIPDGLFVLHRCDNPCCVNPGHLFLGTKRDNRLDAIAKFRVPLGESHPLAKLTAAKVIEARQRYADGESIKALSVRFGVDTNTMGKAIKGKTWKHVAVSA